ncbi:MAG: acyltransferase family protein [Peptoniphilus sp.]|nr:acyltransferase family protein [Peptoniphilus sp.]MDD7363320.1 acyltransferase family protein [Bacillota bacterium]MDY6044047.1 acyltransferase family protein [Peptoniphilus sp.]
MTIKQKRTIAGIKGFALCFILVYMAFSQAFLGGHLGYQFLFALFGYVTFDAYIKQKVYPGPFFVEKVKALWPQLVAMIAVTTVIYAIFFAADLPMVRGGALSGLFFVNNIFQGAHGYPLSIHQPSPFGHLWFVSLLLQCYFIFALFVAGRKTRQKIISVMFLAGGVSIVTGLLMAIYGGLGLTESRIFYMPDSRIFSFFIPFLVVFYAAFSKKHVKVGSREIAMLGIIIVFVILSLFMRQASAAYFGGLFLSSILVSLFLLFLFRGDSAFESVFHFPLFTFLGDRAYPLYLYSMPVFYFVRAMSKVWKLNDVAAGLIALVVLLFVAQVSYYVFEVRELGGRRVLAAMAAIFVAISVYSFATQPSREMEVVTGSKKVVKTVESNTSKQEREPSVTEQFQPSDELAAIIEQVNAQNPKYKLTNKDLGILQSKEALVLGDSVVNAVRESYLKLMPALRIHGSEHLSAEWYVEQLKNYRGEGPIVLQIGNDGPLSYEAVKAIVDAAEGRPVYLFTVVTNSEYEDQNNELIGRIANAYANATVIDWFKETKVQSGFYDEEGRMNQPATRLMAHMLAHSLLYDEPASTSSKTRPEDGEERKTKTEADLTVEGGPQTADNNEGKVNEDHDRP